MTALRSSFFEDTRHVPAGAVQLDCALLMRDVPVGGTRSRDSRRPSDR